ncbi:STAS domain-containing protein [Allosaccharopolyspora coralli]|uniref:STAS domain-containing protein n=1 Tax=Allosaccharopolyspora coralli TaxID=2665642 RepID=A0A5Q3Q2B3_9PSEU|nr:STAS domain-containing protein [Allosaccharopolyspora coralli]QGK68728.1 STAS domain-containing protein [Allosaccharopolyspora coralli]QGK69976.1 STAS domain-containing protein [Allosaccharopolyspora coralli]
MRVNYSLITTLPTVFTVDGDLAGEGVALLAERLWPHVLTGPPATLVDLALATTIDAAGLDLLVAAHAYTAHRRIPLRIVNAAPRVLRVLHAAGVSALPAHNPRAEFATTTATTPALQQNAAVVSA